MRERIIGFFLFLIIFTIIEHFLGINYVIILGLALILTDE